MPIAVYDYRQDVRNLVVRPEFRCRFLRMEPGEGGPFHSHDVGHEFFLILDGRCEFEIEGETAVLGPGQLCVALAGQRHQVRTVGDEPTTMFLAVMPHLEPTHTFWDGEDVLPPRYGSWLAGGRDGWPEPGGPLPALAVRVRDAARLLAAAADGLVAETEGLVVAVEAASAAGDHEGAKAAVDEAWTQIRAVAEVSVDLEGRWNDLCGRFAARDGAS